MNPFQTTDVSEARSRSLITRRVMLQAIGSAVASCWSAAALAAPRAQATKNYGTVPLIGITELLPGDVLHLRVNGLFTSYHEVRPIIHAIQKRMLTSASRSPRSLYFHILRQYREQGLPAHEPIEGADRLQDTVRDLTDTGHTTIYVGGGEVIETTGEGCLVRQWENIDTARYVVMRARQPSHALLIAAVARAIGGSTQAQDVQGAMELLHSRLPPQDQEYLKQLCRTQCQARIVDRYDTISGSKGFFGKLTQRHHIASETPINSMLYTDAQHPPAIHRDTICSSFAALVINLCDRINGWHAIGQTFDRDAMSDQQRRQLRELRSGVGCSTHVRPEWVLPAYLDLGMQVSGQFEIVGQFINIGAAINAERSTEAPLALARPHADYIDATAAFVHSLSPRQRQCIHMPVFKDPRDFLTTDEAILPHTNDLVKAADLYRFLIRERHSLEVQ